MGIPQITLIILSSLGLGMHLAKHGQTTNDKYNFWVKLIAIAIEFSILKWGGFFG